MREGGEKKRETKLEWEKRKERCGGKRMRKKKGKRKENDKRERKKAA